MEQLKKTAFIFLIGLLASALGITGYEIVWDEDHIPEQVRDGDGFEPTTFAAINARPQSPCEVRYFISGTAVLVQPLELRACQPGAPSNSCGAAISLFPIKSVITVDDYPYTRDELIEKVPSPYEGLIINDILDAKVKVLPSKQPCKDEPKDKRPDRLEPAEPAKG